MDDARCKRRILQVPNLIRNLINAREVRRLKQYKIDRCDVCRIFN